MDDLVPDSRSDFYQKPNLERLAGEGIRFTNGYAASPVCSSSRASVQTGMSTARHGITALVGSKGSSPPEGSVLQGTPNSNDDITGAGYPLRSSWYKM